MKYLKLFENDINWDFDDEEYVESTEGLTAYLYLPERDDIILLIKFEDDDDYYCLLFVDEYPVWINNNKNFNIKNINGHDIIYIGEYREPLKGGDFRRLSDDEIQLVKDDVLFIGNDYDNENKRLYKYSLISKIFDKIVF